MRIRKILEWGKRHRLKSNLTFVPPPLLAFYVKHYDAKKIDPHLRPQYLQCDFCGVPVDFLGKCETRSRDFGLIVRRLGLEGVWAVDDVRNEARRKQANNKTCQFFSRLNELQIRHLYEAYEMDFLLFGYKFRSKEEICDEENQLNSQNTKTSF